MSLPLFYKNVTVLSQKEFDGKSFKGLDDYSFSASTNSVPLALQEVRAAAANYPIVFVKEGGVLACLLGGSDHTNKFIDEQGKWKDSHYIPAYIRRFPFIDIAITDSDQTALAVEVNEGINDKGEGWPFFKDGEATEQASQMLQFCQEFSQGARAVQAMIKRLDELDLLVANQVNYTPANGEQTAALSGFEVISAEKWDAVSDEVVLEFKERKWLEVVYAHFFSLWNFQKIFSGSK